MLRSQTLAKMCCDHSSVEPTIQRRPQRLQQNPTNGDQGASLMRFSIDSDRYARIGLPRCVYTLRTWFDMTNMSPHSQLPVWEAWPPRSSFRFCSNLVSPQHWQLFPHMPYAETKREKLATTGVGWECLEYWEYWDASF